MQSLFKKSLVSLGICAAVAATNANADADLTTLYLTDQVPPGGLTAAQFVRFASINESGQVAITAYLHDDTEVTWLATPGDNQAVFASGLAFNPGLHPGMSISAFRGGVSPSVVSESGALVGRVQVSGPGVTEANDSGILAGAPGAMDFVVREGDPVTDENGNPIGDLVFKGFAFDDDNVSSSQLALSHNGEVAFMANYEGTGVSYPFDNGLWVGRPGEAPRLIALTHGPVSGRPGVTYRNPSLRMALNGQGEVIFLATLFGDGLNSSNNEALLMGSPGNISVVAMHGDEMHGIPGLNYDLSSNLSFSINDAGEVAFSARAIESDFSTIIHGVLGALGPMAVPGDMVPDRPALWRRGISPLLSGMGHVAYEAEIDDDSADFDTGLYLHTPGQGSQEITFLGDPAGESGLFWEGEDDHAVNNLGQVTFTFDVDPGTPEIWDDNLASMWAFDPNAGLAQILMEGDVVDVGGGDLRVVDSIQIHNPVRGPQSGTLKPLNDLGQLLVHIDFEDDSDGIFLININDVLPGDDCTDPVAYVSELHADGIIDRGQHNALMRKLERGKLRQLRQQANSLVVDGVLSPSQANTLLDCAGA